MHAVRLTWHDQQGFRHDFDGKLQSGGDVLHMEQQRRVGDVGFGRQRIADLRCELYRHRYQRSRQRRYGVCDRDGEPAADVHAFRLTWHDQQGFRHDFDGKLQSGGHVIHMERQRRVGDVGLGRQRIANGRRDLYRDRHQRGGHWRGGLGIGDGEPAPDLHPVGLAIHHQPGRLDNADRKLLALGDIVYVDQRRFCNVRFERQRVPDFDLDLLGGRAQRGGRQQFGVGDGHGEPAPDVHADPVALHDQPGRVLNADGQLLARRHIVHVDQHRFYVVGIGRQRVADVDRNLLRHGHQCGGHRRGCLRHRDREPAAELRPDCIAHYHQPRGFVDTDGDLHARRNLVQLDQLGVFVDDLFRQRQPDDHHNLHCLWQQRRGDRPCGNGDGDGEPTGGAGLHADGVADCDQPG